MRLLAAAFMVIFLGCHRPKQTPSLTKTDHSSIVDSIMGSVLVKIPESQGEIEWENLTELMNSLENIPFQQRGVTLTTIKNEAIRIAKKSWVPEWENNPVRSRYNVFVTHVSLAAEQRYGDDASLTQAKAIAKMRQSWNIFASHLESTESSAVPESTTRKGVLKLK